MVGCHIPVTSSWARWRFKSSASRLFTQSFIQTQIKENIKAPRHRRPVNSPHKWPVTRKMFPFDDVIMKILRTHRNLFLCNRWHNQYRDKMLAILQSAFWNWFPLTKIILSWLKLHWSVSQGPNKQSAMARSDNYRSQFCRCIYASLGLNELSNKCVFTDHHFWWAYKDKCIRVYRQSRDITWLWLVSTIEEDRCYWQRPYRMRVPCIVSTESSTFHTNFPYHFWPSFSFQHAFQSIPTSHKYIYHVVNVIFLRYGKHYCNMTLYGSPARGFQRIQIIYCYTSIYGVTLVSKYSQETIRFYHWKWDCNIK